METACLLALSSHFLRGVAFRGRSSYASSLMLYYSSYVANPSALRNAKWSVFHMLGSYTRAMGRFFDVVWYDLSVTKSTAFAT